MHNTPLYGTALALQCTANPVRAHRMITPKGVKSPDLETLYHFDFNPGKREMGHFTATVMLQRMMKGAYPDGLRVFTSGVTLLHVSSLTCKMMKLGTCQDSGNMNIPPGLLQNLGNHKSFSCNMIYQTQQQKCLKAPRSALLAPGHLLGLDGATRGVHDVDVDLRLLKHQQAQHQRDMVNLLQEMHRLHGATHTL